MQAARVPRMHTRIVFCLLALAALTGCGYQLQGRVVQGGFGTISLVDPTDQRLQVQGVPGYQNLGQVDAALASQRKSVALFRQLWQGNPADALIRRRFSDQLSNHGRVLMLEGDLPAAAAVLEEGMRLLDGDLHHRCVCFVRA